MCACLISWVKNVSICSNPEDDDYLINILFGVKDGDRFMAIMSKNGFNGFFNKLTSKDETMTFHLRIEN